MTESSWTNVARSLAVGDIVRARVIAVSDPGVFVSIGDGLQALIHRVNVGQTRKQGFDVPELAVGSNVDVVVVAIEDDLERIAISIHPDDFRVSDRWSRIEIGPLLGEVYEGRVLMDLPAEAIVEGPNGLMCRIAHEYRVFGDPQTKVSGDLVTFEVTGKDERHKQLRGREVDTATAVHAI